jgi:diadenosine tetraphosphate (Ap4A) HIT family hydrolase
MKQYDNNNVFAKILRSELPAQKLYEDDNLLMFENIAPIADVHKLIIPKKTVIDMNDFIEKCSPNEIGEFFKSVKKAIETLGLKDNEYKLATNCGKLAGQAVFHLHFHVLAGKIYKNME